MPTKFCCTFYVWILLQLISILLVSKLEYLSIQNLKCSVSVKNAHRFNLTERVDSSPWDKVNSSSQELDAKEKSALTKNYSKLIKLLILDEIVCKKRSKCFESNHRNLVYHHDELEINWTMTSKIDCMLEKLNNDGGCRKLNNLNLNLKRPNETETKKSIHDCIDLRFYSLHTPVNDKFVEGLRRRESEIWFRYVSNNRNLENNFYQSNVHKKRKLLTENYQKGMEKFVHKNILKKQANVILELNQKKLDKQGYAQDFILPKDPTVSFYQSINEDLESDLFPLNRMKNRIVYPLENNAFGTQLEIDQQIEEDFEKISKAFGAEKSKKLEFLPSSALDRNSESSSRTHHQRIVGKELKTVRIRQNPENQQINKFFKQSADSDIATRLIKDDVKKTSFKAQNHPPSNANERYLVTHESKSVNRQKFNNPLPSAQERYGKKNKQLKLVDIDENSGKIITNSWNSVDQLEKIPKFHSKSSNDQRGQLNKKDYLKLPHITYKNRLHSNHDNEARKIPKNAEYKKLSPVKNDVQEMQKRRHNKKKFKKNIVDSVKKFLKNPKSIFKSKNNSSISKSNFQPEIWDDSETLNDEEIKMKYMRLSDEESVTNGAINDSLKKKILRMFSGSNPSKNDSYVNAKLAKTNYEQMSKISLHKNSMNENKKFDSDDKYYFGINKNNDRRTLKNKIKSHTVCKKNTKKIVPQKRISNKISLKSKQELRKTQIKNEGSYHAGDKSSAYYYDYYDYENPEISLDNSEEYSRKKVRPATRKLLSFDDFEYDGSNSNDAYELSLNDKENQNQDLQKESYSGSSSNVSSEPSCDKKEEISTEKFVNRRYDSTLSTLHFLNTSVDENIERSDFGDGNLEVNFSKRSLKSLHSNRMKSSLKNKIMLNNSDDLKYDAGSNPETMEKILKSNKIVENELRKIFPVDTNYSAQTVENKNFIEKIQFPSTNKKFGIKNNFSETRSTNQNDRKIRVKRYRNENMMADRDDNAEVQNQLQNPFKGVSDYLRDRFNSIKGKACHQRLRAKVKLTQVTTDSSGELRCPECKCASSTTKSENQENQSSTEGSESDNTDSDVPTEPPEAANTESSLPEEHSENSQPTETEETTESDTLESGDLEDSSDSENIEENTESSPQDEITDTGTLEESIDSTTPEENTESEPDESTSLEENTESSFPEESTDFEHSETTPSEESTESEPDESFTVEENTESSSPVTSAESEPIEPDEPDESTEPNVPDEDTESEATESMKPEENTDSEPTEVSVPAESTESSETEENESKDGEDGSNEKKEETESEKPEEEPETSEEILSEKTDQEEEEGTSEGSGPEKSETSENPDDLEMINTNETEETTESVETTETTITEGPEELTTPESIDENEKTETEDQVEHPTEKTEESETSAPEENSTESNYESETTESNYESESTESNYESEPTESNFESETTESNFESESTKSMDAPEEELEISTLPSQTPGSSPDWQEILNEIRELRKVLLNHKLNTTTRSIIGNHDVEIEYEKIHIRPKNTRPSRLNDQRKLDSLRKTSRRINRNNFDVGPSLGQKESFEKKFHHHDSEMVKVYLDSRSMNERWARPRKKLGHRKFSDPKSSSENRGIAGGDQRVAHRKKQPRRRKLVDRRRRRGSRQLLSENDFASVGECEERPRNKLHWHYVSRSNKKRKKRTR